MQQSYNLYYKQNKSSRQYRVFLQKQGESSTNITHKHLSIKEKCQFLFPKIIQYTKTEITESFFKNVLKILTIDSLLFILKYGKHT